MKSQEQEQEKEQLGKCLYCNSASIAYLYIPFCSDKHREMYHDRQRKIIRRMTSLSVE